MSHLERKLKTETEDHWVMCRITCSYFGMTGTLNNMQSHGWNIKVAQHYNPMEMASCLYITGSLPQERGHMWASNVMLDGFVFDRMDVLMEALKNINVKIDAIADIVEVHGFESSLKFYSVDFNAPSIPYIKDGEILDLRMVNLFHPLNDSPNIYIPGKSITSVRDGIKEMLKLQEDEQKEIRNRMRRRDIVSKGSLQLISV